MNFRKKFVSVAAAAALAVTGLTGLSASAGDANVLIKNTDVNGGYSYLGTYLKSTYYGKSGFEIQYQYTEFDGDGKYTDRDTGEEKAIDYSDTFEFLAFDTNWSGWTATKVGQSGTPDLNTTYTATVDISAIEATLGNTVTPYGINFETGRIGDTKVKVVSLKYVNDTTLTSEGLEVDCTWTKGSTDGTINSKTGSATVTLDQWKIDISQLCVYNFKNPTIDVTVNYATAPNNYVQAEILDNQGNPILPNYPKVTTTGSVTYTTEFDKNLTAMSVCYDSCTVTNIKIYDNFYGKALDVSGQTANTINANLSPSWNLGNALDSTDGKGNSNESAWGNPYANAKLFKAVKDAGFNSVRIPVSYLNKVSATGDVDDDYLYRIKRLVDDAIDCGLYVIIDVQHDGGDGVTGKWIDVSLENGSDAFIAVVDKFGKMWTEIATTFAGYNQQLLFEGMNEVMLTGKYTQQSIGDDFENVYANICDLNQAFVNAVRGTGTNDANDDRVLIVPGYNTNIDITEAGFETIIGEGADATSLFAMPADNSKNRAILSVHYYDPYDFTLNTNGGTPTWDANGTYGSTYMATQIAKVTDKGVPVFIGEYSAIFRNDNASSVAAYAKALNQAAKNVTAVSVSTAYWDNGVTGDNGTALFDRNTYAVTTNGQTVINAITSVYHS